MDDKALVELAKKARANAYAPYSGFSVGAAVLAADGRVFSGCNIENASYGLTNCAERTAIFSAVAAGARELAALAVVADGPRRNLGSAYVNAYPYAHVDILAACNGPFAGSAACSRGRPARSPAPVQGTGALRRPVGSWAAIFASQRLRVSAFRRAGKRGERRSACGSGNGWRSPWRPRPDTGIPPAPGWWGIRRRRRDLNPRGTFRPLPS